MNLKSIFLCPCCGNNLRLETAPEIVLYCSNGPRVCPVLELNNGETGATELEAYNKLVKLLEELTDSGQYNEPNKGWFYRRNLTPNSPNWENTDIAKLTQVTFEELTGG